jgi:CelD/BcsL family acetyltransferase involved in cellulose biosynthesis
MTAKVPASALSFPMSALDSASSMIASVRRASAADRVSARSFEIEYRPLAELETLVAPWQDLAAHALEPNIFYEPGFALAAAPLFGKDVFVGLVWSSEPRGLLGFFPVRADRRRYGVPIPVLANWTHPYAPLGTPLVRRDMAEPVIAAWLDHVAHDAGLPDLLLMRLLPDDGPFAIALGAALTRNGSEAVSFDRHQRAMLVPGEDRAGYVDAAVGARKRKELRRQRRRLEETGRVSLSTTKDAAGVALVLADFLALEAGGWKGSAGTAAAGSDRTREFMTRAISRLAMEGQAAIYRLLVGERAVAAMIVLKSGNVSWCWKIAYDEAFARYSPGVLLTLSVTEALMADPALTYADSCATAGHPMIDHLWRARLTLADQLISASSGGDFSFALACRMEALRRVAFTAAKSLRQLLRGP